MQRKFLTNLGLLLFLNFLIKPFWIFGIDRTVQNMVGAAEYGTYFAIFNFTFLFNIILDLGITNFNNRNIAQNNHLLNKHFSSIVILKMLLGVAYVIILFSAALLVGYNLYQLRLLVFLGINQFLISLIFYLRSNVSGLLLFKTDSFLSILDRLLMIGICGALLWGNFTSQAFRIEWFVYSQTLAYLLTAVVAFLVVIKKAAFKRLSWSRPFFLLIIKQSFPYAILVLLMMFYTRVDSVMIERMIPGTVGEKQVGIYASAYRLLDASNMIAYLFSVLLLPIFSKMLKVRQSIEHMVKLSTSLLMMVSVIMAFGSFFYCNEVMGLLYKEHVRESAEVFKFLMGCFIPISATYIFGTLLTANGNLKEMNLMSASAVIINLLLNYFLIPRFMALGSAFASLTTQVFIATLQILVVQRIFKFKVDYLFLGRVLIFVAGVLVINILSKELPGAWIYRFLGMVILSLGLASLLRLVHLRSVLAIVRNE